MGIAKFFRLRTSILDERGVAMMEYALLASGIAVVAIGAVSFLGKGANDSVKESNKAFAAAGIFPDPDADEDRDGVPW